MNKKIFLTFVLILNINLIATDYDDDAAKVDFYVPGILANDALSQVNFLLCFQANTNFGMRRAAGTSRSVKRGYLFIKSITIPHIQDIGCHKCL